MIDNLLQEFHEEAKLFHAEMDKSAEQIKKVEYMFQQAKVNIPFLLMVENQNGLIYKLVWEKHDKDVWRLCIEITQDNFTHEKKPLIECKIQGRLEFIPHLPKFVKAFTEYIKTSREQITETNVLNQIGE